MHQFTQIGEGVFVSEDPLPEEVVFIRENRQAIHHICQRWEEDDIQYFVTSEILWDPMIQDYMCRECDLKFKPEIVLESGGTGCEGQA
jgi:uncharacterized protein YlaI